MFFYGYVFKLFFLLFEYKVEVVQCLVHSRAISSLLVIRQIIIYSEVIVTNTSLKFLIELETSTARESVKRTQILIG